MGAPQDYGHTYITLDGRVSEGGNTPKGGWIAMFHDRVYEDTTRTEHHIEIAINRQTSRTDLEEFIEKSLTQPTSSWIHHEDPKECLRRVLVYVTLKQMISEGELKTSIPYNADGKKVLPYVRKSQR